VAAMQHEVALGLQLGETASARSKRLHSLMLPARVFG
jgi:hypothetical protein